MQSVSVSSSAGREAAGGIGLYVLAVFLLAVMDVLIKWLSASYSTGQIVFFRALFGLLPVTVVVVTSGGLATLRTKRLGAHIGRGLIQVVAAFSFFYAFRVMPLADAYAIAFAAPIFMTALSVPLLGERVGMRRWLAVGVGFAGVVVMVRPGGEGLMSIGAAAALVGTLFFSTAAVLIRRFARTETNAAIVVYQTLVMLIVSGATLPFDFVMPDLVDLGLLACTGILGGLGILAIAQAFRLAPPAVVAPFEYTAMIWGVGFGYAIWGDLPDEWVIAGGVIVVASGLYILHRETMRKAPAKPPARVSAAAAVDGDEGRPSR